MAAKELKGASHCILETLEELLAQGKEPSTFDLARSTGYTERHIQRVLFQLRETGYIRIKNDGIGKKNHYEVVEEVSV